MRPPLALLALLLTGCIAGPPLQPEPWQPDDDGSTFLDLLGQPRVDGSLRGTLQVGMPELGQTVFDAIYLDYEEERCLSWRGLMAGDGISCEAFYQWERTCQQALLEGVEGHRMQGWDRFFGEPPWILQTWGNFDQLVEEVHLPMERQIHFEIDQYGYWGDPEPMMVDIFDDFDDALITRVEETLDGLQVEFETPRKGLYYYWDGDEWAPTTKPLSGRSPVRWNDVPRCTPTSVL